MAETSLLDSALPENDHDVWRELLEIVGVVETPDERLVVIRRLYAARVDAAHLGNLTMAEQCVDLLGLAGDALSEQRVRLACGRPE